MGILIVMLIALLAFALLLGLVAKLAVQLGVLALIVMAVAAIGTLWLSAAMAFATYFGIVEFAGREHIGWAVAGALLTGVVVWGGVMRGIWRELLSAPDRWRQKRHNRS